MHRASYCNVYISRPTRCTNSYNASLLSLSALHVSDSLVHHQERRFGAVYRIWYKPVRLAVVLDVSDSAVPAGRIR